MTVIYIDSVFVLNTVMDYLLFLVTARISGIVLKRGRYLLAAVLGGAYAAMVFLPGLVFLAVMPVKLSVGILLSLIAFGGERRLLRLTVLLFGISCGMAGSVLALGLLAGSAIPMENGIFYTNVDATVLLLSAAAAYFVLTLAFRAAARHSVKGEVVSARLCMAGKTAELAVLLDNGNALREPQSGRPVLVAAPETIRSLLPSSFKGLLTEQRLCCPADLIEPIRQELPELRPRLIPYRTVGMPGGLLLMLQSTWLEIGGERQSGVSVAVAPVELGQGYTALWGGEIKGGFYEKHRGVDSSTVAAAETVTIR